MSSTSAPTPLRIAVAGAGAFGRNHLRVYAALQQAGEPIQLAAIIDTDAKTLAAAVEQYAVPGFPSVAACLASGIRLDAASVCVPTRYHAEVASELLHAGVDLLIEKPIATTLAEADTLIALAESLGRIVQIGHLERFNPAVTAVRRLLNRPMFFEAHRLSIFTARSLDVDVVLDLMIHDLDIVLSLVGSPVREVRAVGLAVLSPKVDIANVRLEFESGAIANFTASRVSTERVRKLRFFQPHQYLSLDFARQDLLMIDVTAAAGMSMAQLAGFAAMLAPAAMPTPSQKPGNEGAPQPESAAAQQHPSPGLSLRKLPVQPGEPLKLEIESFLASVRSRTTPVVSARDGRAALAVALAITEAIDAHARRAGLTLA